MFEAGSFVALGVLLEIALQLALAAFILLRSRGTPQVRLTWVIVVLALPVAGLLVYLVLGEVRLGRRRIERHRAVCALIEQVASEFEPDAAQLSDVLGRGARIAYLARTVSGARLRPGNRLRLYSETDHAIDALVEDIERSARSCHLLFYIWLPDGNGARVGEALSAAARRGVTCRVLVDSIGSKLFLRSALRRRMADAGVEVVEALPAGLLRSGLRRIDHRNHRKIVVIDGRIGWTGSQNIADAAFAIKARFAPWFDLMVRLEGPAVHDLQVLFTEDWLLDRSDSLESILTAIPEPFPDGVPALVVGTGPLTSSEALRSLTQLGLLMARQEVALTTPYFVPDEVTVAALRTAAQSGVVTRLVVPRRNDSPLVAAASRSYYDGLLAAGVDIHEFRSGLLHAKTMTVDGGTSVVATANMDRRSFELNFEVNLVVFDPVFTRRLRAVQQSYIDDSVLVEGASWRRRGWSRRLTENALGVLAPLL